MKPNHLLIFFSLFLLTACTGAETITKKRWENRDTTIKLVDITSQSSNLADASSELGMAIEDALDDSAFVVTDRKAHFVLKYKVVEYQQGSRWKRALTFGIDEGSRALLKAKIALYNAQGMLAAWEVDSWVNGGPTGGSESSLYEQAAEQVFAHLKGY